MISYLMGKVLKRMPSGIILDVKGVGYELALPLPTLASLPSQSEDLLGFWVYTKVREDAINLYGFSSWEERQSFEILIQISGVGPKVAMAILSTLDVADLHMAIDQDEARAFYQVPGIGKRTAEKILLELKAKKEKLPNKTTHRPGSLGHLELGLGLDSGKNDTEVSAWEEYLRNDLHSALENLGFKDKDINPVIKVLEKDHKEEDFSNLVKMALKLIAGGAGEKKRQGAQGPRHKAKSFDVKTVF
ncbi:MAG: Holliday junction branch migration protein RuvA [Oligoflexales bacterium]|nr:Holliday junction branch migration protein RuvA [Oligoflexales bacterium]